MCLVQIVFWFHLYWHVNFTRLHSPSDLLYAPTTAIWGELQPSRAWLRYLISGYEGARPLEDDSLTWLCSALERYLFILGYTTLMLYCVLTSPESGGSLLLMICWFYCYICRSMLLMRPSLTQSLDNQHVSSGQISPVSPLLIVGIANGVVQGIVSLA